LVSFGIGFPLGFASYQEGGFINLGESWFENGLVGGAIFAVPSTIIGLIVGASKGGEDKYILTMSAVQKKSRYDVTTNLYFEFQYPLIKLSHGI